MAFHLHIENFRCLRTVDLDLGGVCVLIGPNGSGKSTLLAALRFMRDVLNDGALKAVENAGGGGAIQNFSSKEGIVLRANVKNLVWEIFPKPMATSVQWPMEERFSADGATVVEQLPNVESFRIAQKEVSPDKDQSLFFQMFGLDVRKTKGLLPLTFQLFFYEHYCEPVFGAIRKSGSPAGSDTELRSDGGNIFTVLRNWKAGDRKHEERFEFVRQGIRKGFPGLFETLDFETAGQIVSARFYMPQNDRPIPFHLAPTGLLAGLLHLTAVASCQEGTTVAIDEFENSLHPHAIRVLIDHIRERAAKMDLNVLLASHSPVVLNQFHDCPSKVIVMDPVNPPTPLDKLENPEWLAQFSLGELYANENIGAIKTAS